MAERQLLLSVPWRRFDPEGQFAVGSPTFDECVAKPSCVLGLMTHPEGVVAKDGTLDAAIVNTDVT